jgi:DNA-directed RNA polymerase alpha subunit
MGHEDIPWRSLEWSTRVAHCLSNTAYLEGNGWWTFGAIDTLGDIAKISDGELLGIPNLGRKSLDEIKEMLARYDLTTREHFLPCKTQIPWFVFCH